MAKEVISGDGSWFFSNDVEFVSMTTNRCSPVEKTQLKMFLYFLRLM